MGKQTCSLQRLILTANNCGFLFDLNLITTFVFTNLFTLLQCMLCNAQKLHLIPSMKVGC